MSGQKLLDKLGNELDGIRGRLQVDALMANLTWLRVGGTADLLFQPADEEDLSLFLSKLPEEVPVFVVGVGSNLLVRDGGIDGVVIRLSAKGFGEVTQVGETEIRSGASVLDKKLAAYALEFGIGGFEFYHGIPGGIGGALRMNAGANGAETTERVVEVTAIDRAGKRHVLSHADMGYSYRSSKASKDLIFTSALFKGVGSEKERIKTAMDEVQNHRETVQPVKEKTGGSTFKNPEGNSSWRLIDEAGLRGFKVGDAQMSEMHCNFMINTGNASAFDLETLGETVRERVFHSSRQLLEWEIKRIGNFENGKQVEFFNPS